MVLFFPCLAFALLAATRLTGDEVGGAGEEFTKAQELGLAILDEAGLRALLKG